MKTYRYITIYLDITLFNNVCELVQFASSLPEAIKQGRSYVRSLNNDNRRNLPAMRRYHYVSTYRSR